jgi:hypothetical protein
MISFFEQAKTVYALYRAATVIGKQYLHVAINFHVVLINAEVSSPLKI